MIGFASPWLLAALAMLPALWLWLRLLPPRPRVVRFPALRLLVGLGPRRDTAARAPWWLLALRLSLLALAVIAAAGPMLHPAPPPTSQAPLLVVIDDGWAAARDWTRRQDAVAELLAQATRRQRPVLLVGTAPPADGGAITVAGPMSAGAAQTLVRGREPKPWPADYAATARALAAVSRDSVIEANWIADGIDPDGQGRALAAALQGLGGGVTVLTAAAGRVLRLKDGGGDQPAIAVQGLAVGHDQRLAVRAVDGAGQVLAREELTIPAGAAQAEVRLRLPVELRNRLARLDIEDEASAAATVLLDDGWKRRLVGLAGEAAAATPLLAPLYYVERALAPIADIRQDDLGSLLSQRPDALVLADQTVPATAQETLRAWIKGGGILLRFAGPALAGSIGGGGGQGDGLLPVRLRPGGRALGGAMSWTEAQGLAAFPGSSPLAGLAVPADVRVSAQVLAEPDATLAERSWAHLSDGTPLITGERLGRGWVVLVHTTANTTWSNLALSGLFPDLLRRLVALGQGTRQTPDALPASEVLDGFGLRHPAAGAVRSLPADPAARRPGPQTPPGLYGLEGARQAFNLSPHLPAPVPLLLPAGVGRLALEQRAIPHDLTGAVLAAALVVLMADLLLVSRMRGAAALAVVLAGAVVSAPPARADDAFALRAALSTRLAFVRTGDGFIDGKTRAGLTALSQVVGERSTARLDSPMAVDLETDPILFFPIVYWPLSATQGPLSAKARDKLNAYMRSGGLLVLDTGSQGGAGQGDAAALRPLTEGLDIPPLVPVSGEHVLTRSFYLLKELPGRWDGPAWVAGAGGDDRDGVSPVVVGGNDWAGAWATDPQGRPSFPCVPGGERQRELAWRLGVNLVMYALTGNYKADQVHLPAILERLGQ